MGERMKTIDKKYKRTLDNLMEWRLNMNAQYPEFIIITEYSFNYDICKLLYWRFCKIIKNENKQNKQTM